MANKVLVTGTAGFIGYHLADKLLRNGYVVTGLDIINDYYDPSLKHARLSNHGIQADALQEHHLLMSHSHPAYRFLKADLADHDFIVDFMKAEQFDVVINLAAQAGVRYSLENPRAYTHANIDGFLSLLEGARYSGVKHLIYASTSSVYGLNKVSPLSELHPTEHPMALYAATKKANEMMAHSYSHLFDIPTSGLRFFTVYGPWGRPDMALFLFTKAMLAGEPIKVFNHGNMIRDFTFVEDITESILRLIPHAPVRNDERAHPLPINASSAPYAIYNIGNSSPVRLMEYIESLEKALGIEAQKDYLPMQPGDVPATHADVHSLESVTGFRPSTSVEEGVRRFVEWYRSFYGV